jgi:hypothetical protein
LASGASLSEINVDWVRLAPGRKEAPPSCVTAGQRGLPVLGAEDVGFEPTEMRNASPVFKTVRSNVVTRQDFDLASW